MKKRKAILTASLLVLAAALLFGSSIGSIRAELTIESEDYKGQAKVYNIGVALLENGNDVTESQVLLGDLLKRNNDTKLHAGRVYDEVLTVKNTGDIDEYVRVTVYKYWTDEQGVKYPDMDSAWIILGFDTSDGWSIDEESTTEERTVLYYDKLLAKDEESTPFLRTISLDSAVLTKVTQESQYDEERGVTIIETTFEYNGKNIHLDAEVDGVQSHSPEKAKISSWGADK